MKIKFIFLILAIGLSSTSMAQEFLSVKNAEKINRNESGNIQSIYFKKDTQISVNQTLSLLKQIDGDQNHVDYVLKSSKVDKQKIRHDEYTKSYNGIPVAMEVYKVHSKDGFIISANGEFSNLNLTANLPNFIGKDQAFQLALQHINAEVYAWEANEELNPKSTPELVILPSKLTKEGNARFAYRVDVYALEPLSRNWVYVDAESGQILFKDPIIKHANGHGEKREIAVSFHPETKKPETFLVEGTGDTRYSGTQSLETTLVNGKYILKDSTRKISILNSNRTLLINITEFQDDDNVWSSEEYDNENKDNAALEAFWGISKTYDFFKETFDRDSYDDRGSQLRGYVHYDFKEDNAFWSGNSMLYGDGSSNGQEGNGLFDALVSIDVTAHEIGHGVCQSTAGLIYERESGALNEGFSDIWGAVVEYYAAPNDPNKDKWLIGEEIDRRNNSLALRSMKDPKKMRQPNTYKGRYWISTSVEDCPTPDFYQNDYCGVHKNSGVLNYWFYLLSEGGSGVNDNGDAYDVAGIGIEKAAQIAYCAESNYLTYNSKYQDAKEFTIQCSIDIFGEDSTESQVVKDAWFAVGLGDIVLRVDDMDKDVFAIYPNPAKEYLSIQSKKAYKTYQILNLNGQIVEKGNLVNGRINVSRLPIGNYVLQLERDGQKYSQKFIKK